MQKGEDQKRLHLKKLDSFFQQCPSFSFINHQPLKPWSKFSVEGSDSDVQRVPLQTYAEFVLCLISLNTEGNFPMPNVMFSLSSIYLSSPNLMFSLPHVMFSLPNVMFSLDNVTFSSPDVTYSMANVVFTLPDVIFSLPNVMFSLPNLIS